MCRYTSLVRFTVDEVQLQAILFCPLVSRWVSCPFLICACTSFSLFLPCFAICFPSMAFHRLDLQLTWSRYGLLWPPGWSPLHAGAQARKKHPASTCNFRVGWSGMEFSTCCYIIVLFLCLASSQMFFGNEMFVYVCIHVFVNCFILQMAPCSYACKLYSQMLLCCYCSFISRLRCCSNILYAVSPNFPPKVLWATHRQAQAGRMNW